MAKVKGFGIKAGKLPTNAAIKAGNPESPRLLSFSFRYMDRQHQKFDYSGRDAAYFCKVIERLSALSSLTVQQLHAERSPALRAHPIAWDDTTEPEGFGHLNEQLRESRPYQFSISSNAHGRVHGFFLDHVFYVVWLDPNHKLYS
ncbi:hypothetical protein B2J73_16215 [Stutzerimonas stutzeri]|uniref:hypothetical protein n=1 Tax=Stutzerimonas stutzeri TaxID=316 RepID=UPI00066D5C64|nr:hypothetical protein [Stutzerimonas stutzeri]MBH3353832.1 hypothetical protein [Stutzerimonas stutzeri]OPG82412.1 hypothetical protein B2J73_16215 [Stutzerimonas stutzeri]